MASMASRRNGPHAMPRKTDNSPRGQGAAIANSSSSIPGFSLQRTPYNTRQSLSRSYDFPDGTSRMSQASSKKFGSPILRRSASPPASSINRKHNNCATGINQTILDDAAWMSERIQNLHKTGFTRYPSMSKLRDPSRRLSASNEDYEETLSCPSSSSCNQTLNSLQNQTNEPLSAFRLSEVTLSEEDLLTDTSSTCNSTPGSLQSGRLFDQTVADFYQGSSYSHDAERNHSDITNHILAAPSKNSPSNIRGDLLLRLEALQHRAELAAKASHTINFDSNQDSPYFKDPWNGQVFHLSKDSLPSNHSGNAVSQQSNSAASPTYSTLEATSWPEESENFSDSTCWLKAMNEDVKTEPFVRHPIHSSSRIIRPEYYLPLSKEEEPVYEPVASCLSSPMEGRKLDLKGDNLALRRSSLVCQRRSEHTKPSKLLNSHKQNIQATKSRKFLERSMDLVSRSVISQGVISVTGPPLCPTAARKAPLTEVKSTYAGYNSPANEFMLMEDPKEEAAGQKKKSRQSENGSDREVSWISEENVEGFLRSRCFSIDEVDALDTSRGISDTNECSITITPSSFVSGKHSQTKDNEESELHSFEQSCSISSDERDSCSHSRPSQCIKQSMERSSMLEICQERCLTSNNRISSPCQVLEGRSLAHSCPPSPDFDDDQNLMPRPVCQVYHLKEDKVGMEAQSGTLESQQQVQSKHVVEPVQSERCISDKSTPAMTTELTSSDTTMLSPQNHLIKHRHGQVVAQGYGKVSPSDGLSEKARSHSEHRNFTKIARSLSFGEKGKGELERSSKQNTCNELGESKSTSFSHYWIRNSAYSLDISELLGNEPDGFRKADEVSLSPKNFVEALHSLTPQKTGCFIEQELPKKVTPLANKIGVSAKDKMQGGTDATLPPPNESCMAASVFGTGEVSATRSKFSQQSHQHRLDNSTETLQLQDDSMVESVKKDKDCWQQLNDFNEMPTDAEKSEMDDKVILQETLRIEKDACLRVLSHQYKNELDQTEQKISEEMTLSEKHISELSINCQNNRLMSEDTMKGSGKLICSTSFQKSETERMKITPSMLSVYKNPLWLDEDSADFENHDNFQDEEFLDFTCFNETSTGFLDSDKAKLRCSKRSEDKTWDTYEGMGAFISTFPNSPCCANDRMFEAQDNLMGFPNCGDLDPLRDEESKTKSKLKNSSEDVEDGHASVCKFQASKSCSTSEELITSELSGYDAKQKLSAYVQSDQDQLLVLTPKTTLRSNMTSHALSSSSVEVMSIADDNCNFPASSSSLLLCCEGRLHLKDISTTCTQVSSQGARKPDSLEKCFSEQVIWPDSVSLTSNNVAMARGNTENDLLDNTPSIFSTREESLLLSELSCQSDEPAGEPVVKANHDTKRERSRQESCTSIETLGVLSTQLTCVVQQNEQSSQEYKRKHLYALDHEVTATKARKSLKGPNILSSDDEMEVDEEVKRVTFVYSDSNEPPQKNAAVTLPEVPLDLLSTWVVSLFSHATKGGENLKKKEQKQPLIRQKSKGNEKDLNRIGEKVEVLEAEISKFKRENKKLKNLMKSMIRKMKQFQQDFYGKRRRRISRGFMTCIYSVRVQRSKSKTLKNYSKSNARGSI